MFKSIKIVAGTLAALTVMQTAAMAAPFDRFRTMDEAAIDWGKYYNSTSIRKKVEYGSYIFGTWLE